MVFSPLQAIDSSAFSWATLAERILSGGSITFAEAIACLECPDTELLALLTAAYRVRYHYFGNKVHLHLLMNAQSGLCPEDCHYCSQSRLSAAQIDKYPLQSREMLLAGAKRASELQASTYCIVTSGRGPTKQQVEFLSGVVQEIKETVGIKICCCLGLLEPEQAEQLKEAGVDRYNHNLNTSANHTPNIVTSHGYGDRLSTADCIKQAGISLCSGAIFGMGETHADRVDVAFALHRLGAASIPVNFLIPIAGTPLANSAPLTPNQCLKILAMMRLVNPDREIRIAGGREVQLRSLQPLGLYAANSIFIGDYLTTQGQAPSEDYQMIADLGFEVEQYPT
jgi:biotin synthase